MLLALAFALPFALYVLHTALGLLCPLLTAHCSLSPALPFYFCVDYDACVQFKQFATSTAGDVVRQPAEW